MDSYFNLVQQRHFQMPTNLYIASSHSENYQCGKRKSKSNYHKSTGIDGTRSKVDTP